MYKRIRIILFSGLTFMLMSAVGIFASELDISSSGALQIEIVPNNDPAQHIPDASFSTDVDSIIVYSFDQLKSALSDNNGYINIYLGADINMDALGIEINPNKKRVIISGRNPLDDSGPYTINEYNSLDPLYTIRVVSDTGTKEVIMRNINVTGRNFYGVVCVYDGVNDVTVTFENVNYNGPQLLYNRSGTLRITGDSYIRITGDNGISIAHEVAEVATLELGGNVVIDHYSPLLSALWLIGKNSSIKVLSDANVIWNEKGTYMIYQDNLNPATFTMDKDAKLTINTLNGLFYNNSNNYHQFGNVFIDAGASLKISQNSQSSSSIPIMKIKNSLQILDNASFVILAHEAPHLLYMTGDVDITAKSPNTLVLYNKAGKLIDYYDSSLHSIAIVSSFINYWDNPCDLGALGSFNDYPLYRWRKKNGEDMQVDIATTSTLTESVSSNYTEFDYGIAPSAELLNLQKARIITAGRLSLELGAITDTASHISGKTAPNASICVIYTNDDGNKHTTYGHADSGGWFDIALQKNCQLLIGSEVHVFSSIDYKNVMETTTVIQGTENRLMFLHVPQHMVFPKSTIDTKRKLIPRQDNNWHIIIGDSRSKGSQWELYAKLVSPLTGTHNDTKHVIDDAVVFLDDGGSKTIAVDCSVKICDGIKNDETESIVTWPSDIGIMLNIDTLNVYSNIDYSARIQWILVDGP